MHRLLAKLLIAFAFSLLLAGSASGHVVAAKAAVLTASIPLLLAPEKVSPGAALRAKWGHLSAQERRTLLDTKAEASAERWVRSYQGDLNELNSDLQAHFWDKHAPDIPPANIERRSVTGQHPRTGDPGIKRDSSQFGSFKTMMHVLNEATTRQTRGLTPYNNVDGKPWVHGTFGDTAGHGYLKVPGNSPLGTLPVYVPSYTNWVVRFDPGSGLPYTAFPNSF